LYQVLQLLVATVALVVEAMEVETLEEVAVLLEHL